MEQTERASPHGSTKTIVLVAVAAVGLLGAGLFLALGGAKPPVTTTDNRPQENAPLAAREALAKKTDLNTCRNALEQLNSYYNQTAKDHPTSLDPTTREALQDLYGLDADETAEIAGDRFTLLDGY